MCAALIYYGHGKSIARDSIDMWRAEHIAWHLIPQDSRERLAVIIMKSGGLSKLQAGAATKPQNAAPAGGAVVMVRLMA